MNKFKKIAIAVTSVVMAGTMCMSFTACGPDDGGSGAVRRSTELQDTQYNVASPATAEVSGTTLSVKSSGSKELAYPKGTTLNMNVCDGGNSDRHISYHPDQISASAVMPDGYTYMAGDLKPAWWQMSQALGVNFVDKAKNRSSDAQINDMISNQELADYQIVTGSGSAITNQLTQFLNLNDYLDYMPNYKAFLDANPIVKWSLTTNTQTGAMYYAPYFDGNNDIEKYVITHREWTRALLDSSDVSAADTTWTQSKTEKENVGSNLVYAQSFMGTEGSWTVDATDPENDEQTVKVKVNYGAALEAAQSETTPLGSAIKAAAGKAYTGSSGNIVDIQNFVINETDGAVKGSELIAILRAYIDVAYTDEQDVKFYDTRSDVFNSVSAAWDVDLLTALSRCVVTSYKLFGEKIAGAAAKQIYAIAGRQGTTQRRVDLNSLVGELYGVRGLESRLELYTYIDANGDLKDSREDAAAYDAMDKMSALAKEGLIYTGTSNTDKVYKDNAILSFLIHDYSQTQTTDGFFTQGIEGVDNAYIIKEGDLKFDFAPILTPVSNWDTNSDGTAETIMRFTESWRAVKNTGFCVPKAAVTDPNVLSATLNFIDYLFSNDGQIIATYGPMSTNGNATGDEVPNGFWYADEQEVNIDTVAEKYEGSSQYHVKDAYKGQYFVFENKVYKGTSYNGRQIPTLTTNTLNYYYGAKVNGHYLGEGDTQKEGIGYIGNPARNYTNFARGIIGGALPLGNKDQGFEYQATADCGLDGSAVVATALNNGTIKHLTQEVSESTFWYTCVPTTLPIDSTDGATLRSQLELMGKDETAGLFLNTSKTAYRTNLYIDLMFYGYGANKNVGENEAFGTIPANAAGCIELANSKYLQIRLNIYRNGWNALKTYYGV